MTMLNAAQCSVTELFKGARNELKEAEAKSTAQLTALTQQRNMVVQMMEVGTVSFSTACQFMDTWIWENKNIFTSHDWLYYSNVLDFVIQPNHTVLLGILDPLLRARQQDADRAGEIRVSISISEFETCLRDWSRTEQSPQHIQQIIQTYSDTPPINHTLPESPTKLDFVGQSPTKYRERIEKEWVEMVTRVFPGNVANFVPTHGGKAHRRTPSWWEGCSTNTQ